MSAPRVVIVGHVEWVTHTRGLLPARGLIADLQMAFGEPAGGGGVAAAASVRLGAATTLLTALGNDPAARKSRESLAARGVTVVAATRDVPQTPVLTVTEPDGERTIMVIGERLQAHADDGLVHAAAAGAAAAYYTGEDPQVLAEVRDAVPVLVVTGRRRMDLVTAGVRPDVIVASAHDPDEQVHGLPDALRPAWTVYTDGARGGTLIDQHGVATRYAAADVPGVVVDSYGCGDSFAAGLTVGLARGLGIGEAIALGARAGAACATWRGGIGPA